MSYILEALKRSQQERELGHVPTLETNLFLGDEGGARPNPWVILAVGLATLAVGIALYAALRGTQSVPELTPVNEEPAAAATSLSAESGEGSAPATPEPVAASTVESASQPAPAEAEAVPSSPEQPPATAMSEKTQDTEVAEVSPAPVARPARPKKRPAIPERPAPPPVPEDVRADIEAFKNDVFAKKSGGSSASRGRANVPPQDLRLPDAVQNRLPAFIMSAHVHDKDRVKRFVVINSLKTMEGGRTREGITVEEILADGAVLSFEGHKFFRKR